MQVLAKIINIGIVACLSIVSGCALIPETIDIVSSKPSNAQQQFDSESLVAADILSALVQVNTLSPEQVSILVADPQSTFEVYLKEALQSAGYRQHTSVDTRQALTIATKVFHNSERVPTAAGGVSRTYQVEVGDVKIKRDYEFASGRVVPRSHMFVKGADTSTIKLDDSIFHESNVDQTTIDGGVSAETLNTANTVAGRQLGMDTSMQESESQPLDRSSDDGVEAPLIMLDPAEQGTYLEVGDTIQVTVESIRNAQVHCYYQDGEGTVVKLFPNRFTPKSLLRAGEALVLPASEDKWQLTATAAGKLERFMCMAVEQEFAERLSVIPEMPDLQPLPDVQLTQIYSMYKQAVGADLINQNISFAVN